MGWKDIGNVGGSLRRGDVGIENISNGKVIILEKYWWKYNFINIFILFKWDLGFLELYENYFLFTWFLILRLFIYSNLIDMSNWVFIIIRNIELGFIVIELIYFVC